MPPPKQPQSPAVHQRLRRQIESLELAPGTRLSEVALAERLGVSRTPVREAIRQLSHEGLVSFTPGEVARVAPISLQHVRSLFEFRMILEPAALHMITVDGSNNAVSLDDFRAINDELDQLAEEFDSFAQQDLARRFYALTERFDQAITETCHNELLATTIVHRRGQTIRLRGIAHAHPQRLEHSLDEHRRMCRAVLDGEPSTAESELLEHLSATMRSIVDSLTHEIRSGGIDVAFGPLT